MKQLSMPAVTNADESTTNNASSAHSPDVTPTLNEQVNEQAHQQIPDQPSVSRRRFLATSVTAATALSAGLVSADAQSGAGTGHAAGHGTGQGKGSGTGQGKGGGGQGGGQGGGGGTGKPPSFSALNLGTSATSPAYSAAQGIDATQGALQLQVSLTSRNFTDPSGKVWTISNLAAYNQNIPGPTLYLDPGSALNLTLANTMPATSPFPNDKCDTSHSHTTPQCFMHTNLHTHGLMVSPSSVLTNGQAHCLPNTCGPIPSSQVACSSDDVLVDIAPGAQNNYSINVPAFHEPGTYWYHAHIHGSTGYQVSSGMAGALIIREPAGMQLVPPQNDIIFLMQEIVFPQPQTIPGKNPKPGNIPAVYVEQSSTQNSAGFLINGLAKPTVKMLTGQNKRLRFINATATPRGLLKLRLIKVSNNPDAIIDEKTILTPITDQDGKPSFVVNPALVANNAYMYLTAVDGLSFYGFAPQPVRQHLMAPGNRADLLLNIPSLAGPNSGVGKYALVKDGFPKNATNFKLNPQGTGDNATLSQIVPAAQRTCQVLAYFSVYPNPFPPDQVPRVIPGTRPAHLQAIASFDNQQTVAFSTSNSGAGPGQGSFQINNTDYDPSSPGVQATLNTVEQWTLTNSGNDIPHPFHIHVNPFQVVGRTIDFETDNPTLDPNNPCNWMWMDTAAIPAQTSGNPPGQLQLRTRFLVFPGEYVLHCHILIHEDHGMMTNVTIKDDGNGIGPCKPVGNYPAASLACINRTKQNC